MAVKKAKTKRISRTKQTAKSRRAAAAKLTSAGKASVAKAVGVESGLRHPLTKRMSVADDRPASSESPVLKAGLRHPL